MPPTGESRSRKPICLAGFMGSGKTTVGRLLASQIGWRFTDLDTTIEEQSSLTIPVIFERLGEPAFREMEYAALLRILGESIERDRPTVLALGGGTVAQPLSYGLLRSNGCVLIWIHCPIDELLTRCALMTNRPLFRDEASFRQLYEQRIPYYEQADYRVENQGDPGRAVEQILALGILERAEGVREPSAGRVRA